MQSNEGVYFNYSKKSYFEQKPNYWTMVVEPLKSVFSGVCCQEILADQKDHDGILIMAIDEVFDELKFSSPRGVIVSFNKNADSKQLEYVQKVFGNSLLGFIDTAQSPQLHTPLFKRIVLESKILGTGGEVGPGRAHLGKILEQSLLELQRVKKLHREVVPLRQEQIKGLDICSKFAAGYSSGGEFFDIKKSDKEIFIISTNTQSYVASSIVLNCFEAFGHYESTNKEILEDFLESLIEECRELELLDRDDYKLLQLDILRLDLRTYEFEGFHFGKGSYYSNGQKILGPNELALNENSFEDAYYNGSLKRSQKLVFVSPGAVQNFENSKELDKIDGLILEQFKNGAREVLNEVFFQLKKDRQEDFLKHDASVIYLEVSQNAFIQV